MSSMVQKCLDLAEQSCARREFQEAVDRLREVDPGSLPPDERAAYHLLWAEAKLEIGDHDIVDSITAAVEYYKNSHDNYKFGRAKFIYGRLLIYTGRHIDARELLNEAYAAFKRIEDRKQQALVLNSLSLIAFLVGELKRSAENLLASVEIYRDLAEFTNADLVMGNVATVYTVAGRLKESILIYQEMDSRVATWANKVNKAAHYIQFSFPLALSGQTEEALKTIDRALPFLYEHNHEQGLYYEFVGRIHLTAGNFKKAIEALQKGFDFARRHMPESGVSARIERCLAEARFGAGDFETARRLTDEALPILERENKRVEVAACHRLYGLLTAQRGDTDQGRHWFGKAIDLLKETGAAYELAVTKYLAGTSGLYTGPERQMLLCLARNYFDGERIASYIEKIDQELSRTPLIPDKKPVPNGNILPAIVTVNEGMKMAVALAEHAAPSGMSILLTGATGTGKDLLARYIHDVSGRTGRFVAVNTAAIPDSMIESELFGHRKGAFTNADRDKTGLIEVADGGTLYLNEIADASRLLQAKLLDVLENRKIRRLGETSERAVNFRLIAASNHDLEKLIADGRFRIDLYHRLGEVPINLPPLRERLDDIRPLLLHFLSQAGVTVPRGDRDFDRLVAVLSRREWPGNVRQLEAEAKRLVLIARSNTAAMHDYVTHHAPSERDQLRDLLEQVGWNRREAARRLNVSDTTIRRRMRKFKLHKD